MTAPLFSVVVIARNEAQTLPRLLDSLAEFRTRGGETVLLDTGSTDATADIARARGCVVYEAGDRFRVTVSADEAAAANALLADCEPPVLTAGDTLFDFSTARNFAAGLARCNMVAMPDCDEVYTRLAIDKIDAAIAAGCEQCEYTFVFSHDEHGNEAIKFLHSKFYDRRKLRWMGVIHEVLAGEAKRQYFGEDVIKLEHWQNPATNRGGYLRGLALDCSRNPTDRNQHYFARELLWTGRPRSAIKQFERHVAMNAWPAERAQSMIFMGDAYGMVGNESRQVEWYQRAFALDGGRREALLRLADFYARKEDHQKVACYAAAALQIPWGAFYANHADHYTHKPHDLLCKALWFLGRRDESRVHFDECLKHLPTDSRLLHDYRYHYPLPRVSIILPWLRREGFDRCRHSIDELNYPKHLLQLYCIYDSPRQGVPARVAEGVAHTNSELICFAADDMEFAPDSLIQAVIASRNHDLVAFNAGMLLPDGGDVCAHFIIRRAFLPAIGGQVFDTDFHHVGVDNLLWAKASKLGRAIRCERAGIQHHHFSRGAAMDVVYQLGWSRVEQDRELLREKLAAIA